jgi:hypothetical protein
MVAKAAQCRGRKKQRVSCPRKDAEIKRLPTTNENFVAAHRRGAADSNRWQRQSDSPDSHDRGQQT